MLIPDTAEFKLRPARVEDDPTIQRMIHQEHLNPRNIDWPRFTVAVAQNGTLIGCGQVKLHADGVHELSSLVVLKAWRGKGVGGALIASLIAGQPGVLYLTCRARLEPLYQHYGFVSLPQGEIPTTFRRIYRLINGFLSLFGQPEGLKVMRRIP